MSETRFGIPRGCASWFDEAGLFHFVRWGDYCVDLAWPWWSPGRLAEELDMRRKHRQQSVASLPEDQQDAAMSATRAASDTYPSVLIEGHLVHVCLNADEWEVWINCEDMDFTGLCIGVGLTRDIALKEALRALESIVEHLGVLSVETQHA